MTLLACAVAQTGANAQTCAPVSDWGSAKRAGDNFFAANNYGAAEKSYLQALKESEKFAPGDSRAADTLHALANLYVTRGQFAKAEPYYERELRVREKGLGPEHPQVVALVGKIGLFYMAHGAPHKGDKICTLLMSFAERKVKDQQAQNAQLAKMTSYYDKSKDYAEATKLLNKLQDETHRTDALENLELATTLDSLGHVFKGKGSLETAEKMYRHALTFRERALAPDHLALSYSYENLANLYQVQGKTEAAQPYFKKSLAITEKTLQPGRPEFFKRLDALAQAQIGLGQQAEAESLYKRALQLMGTANSRPDAGDASLALGDLYIKQQKYAAAEPLMKRALLVAENVNGPQHAALVPILDKYADVLDKLNRAGEANKARARARSIRGVAEASGSL